MGDDMGQLKRIGWAVAVVAALGATTSGCGGGDLTKTRLEHALGPAFRHLYVLQQTELNGSDSGQAPDSWANCKKGGPHTPDRGSGGDWVCVVRWPSGGGITKPISYEVNVQPGGCYTAQGPASLVGQQQLHGADGKQHTNPLYEFDGCIKL